ncbi:Vacuolar iron transporter cccA [Vanrija pseudolonga]|uniref:Vacuolar iron transporter cccA n=1 Tax=Vanrija pseudolonga TaxID=143232 RepID=A0AAF0YA87_9TREE|nr:Vacuolar iron transporter cccA [Vanrija pseudolonga]
MPASKSSNEGTERQPLLSGGNNNNASGGCCGGNASGKCCGGANRATGSSSSLTPASGAAVPLKRGNKASAEPVWGIERTASRTSLNSQRESRRTQVEDLLAGDQPLGTKCGVAHGAGQCCKELKGDDERHLIPPEIVRDIVIGLSDGLTVPFALTAGLSSLGSSRLVVTGGLAELCAGAISMGLGGFLASQAELDHFHYLRRQTHARVLRSCDGEMEREVHAILGPLGVKEALSRLVADDLREVEDDVCEDQGIYTAADIEAAADKPESDPNVGLTAFLLKFGEGMEEVPRSRLWISALTIGLSYFIGGLIPLLPYVFTDSAELGLIWSAIVTGIILLIFGTFKTYFTGATGGVGGYVWGAISMLFVGGLAAGCAFALVKILGVEE